MEVQHKNQAEHGPVVVQHSLLEHIAKKVWYLRTILRSRINSNIVIDM